LKKSFGIALLLTLLITVGCISCEPSYNYQIPEQTKDGWQTASLDDVGIKKTKLGDLVTHIGRKKYQNIHSLLIIKDGKLVFEEYFGGSDIFF
jgi:hypothetical protein